VSILSQDNSVKHNVRGKRYWASLSTGVLESIPASLQSFFEILLDDWGGNPIREQ
jgi:hypothetical protein